MSIEQEIEECKQDDYRDDEIRFLQTTKCDEPVNEQFTFNGELK